MIRKYLYLLGFLLLIPAIYVYATDGVSGVEHPAKVNSVVTPDKVCGVSGLAAGGGSDTSYIVANDDDYYVKPGTSYYNSDNSDKVQVGNESADVNMGLRFQLDVPQGATITVATITMTCAATATASYATKISAHDDDNSAQINDFAGWDTAHGTLTTANVDWDWSNAVEDAEYVTDSLVDIVQEIVSREGWVANNYIQFFIDNDGITNWKYFHIDNYESAGSEAYLSVTYTE